MFLRIVWPSILISVSIVGFFSNHADASSFTMAKLPDQYQCVKASGKEQVVDVLINGSSQRFQGVARSKDGRLIEVAGSSKWPA
jgi:hypothetical protein